MLIPYKKLSHTIVLKHEVIEATVMDRWWQLVLDCLNTKHAPFSKGTLLVFRKRLIKHTIQVAGRSQAFGSRALRAALESSPLWGAERVETYIIRERQQTLDGRTQLRERVAVEHTLAYVGQWQGWRARYCDLPKVLAASDTI